MKFYGGLSKEKVLEIYSFVINKRKKLNCGQRKLFKLVKENFGVEIKENTISNWIFLGLIPFANEKTQFKPKLMPKKEELYDIYINQKESAEKIGKKYNVSTSIVISWLKEYNIKTRNHKESMNTCLVKKELRRQKLKIPIKDYSLLGIEKAYILGVLCGDGYINKNFISFEIRQDKEFAEEFATCFEKVYGLKYNYKYYKRKNTFIVRISNQTICEDLLKYGKFKTREWKVPSEIMESSNAKTIGAFLRGFYDSEGSSSSRSCITCSSVNMQGLEGIAALLKKLGIETTLKSQQNGRYYVLYIFRKGRFKIFIDKIGFTIKRKQDKVNETINTGYFTKRSDIGAPS
ncbi:MAG: LAGLIDADG family homing endonuclease [Nanoarchaeota archaeon]|mgnify:CR=1 FL=1